MSKVALDLNKTPAGVYKSTFTYWKTARENAFLTNLKKRYVISCLFAYIAVRQFRFMEIMESQKPNPKIESI